MESPGDVVYVNLLGQSVVYLNSWNAAHDLLEKRSAIYSDRPRFTMLGEMLVLVYRLCNLVS
jgi:hypothetical protein